jgi:hypothetical protein
MGKWYSVLKDTTVNFCRGYMLGKQDASPPRLSFRLVGMVAGWPTPEQYEAAAARAIERAKSIRAQNEQDERRQGRKT